MRLSWWKGTAKGLIMTELQTAIASIRSSACAILRIRRGKTRRKKGVETLDFQLGFVGSAVCIRENELVLTAHHVLNGGKQRHKNDKFYAFIVPDNEEQAFQFPIQGFPLEDPTHDLAVLELGPCVDSARVIHAAPISFQPFPDGTRVVTYGFPAPEISGANVDKEGGFRGGGRFFLKGHTNEGILAAQYDLDIGRFYEFNVGWHHGESGGAVAVIEPVAVISVMQQYRNINSPHGVVPGPRRGIALSALKDQLEGMGATIV